MEALPSTLPCPLNSPPQSARQSSSCNSRPSSILSLSGSSTPYPSSSSSISPHGLQDVNSPELSIASSALSMAKDFRIPDIWRPSIMQCIEAPTIDEKRKLLGTPGLRGEICRDLVTQMYSFKKRPDRAFCTYVRKIPHQEVSIYARQWSNGIWICKCRCNPNFVQLVSNVCTQRAFKPGTKATPT